MPFTKSIIDSFISKLTKRQVLNLYFKDLDDLSKIYKTITANTELHTADLFHYFVYALGERL